MRRNNTTKNKILEIIMAKETKGKKISEYKDPEKMCPKCGVRMANHKNRFSCGKCGYTEMKKED